MKKVFLFFILPVTAKIYCSEIKHTEAINKPENNKCTKIIENYKITKRIEFITYYIDDTKSLDIHKIMTDRKLFLIAF